MLMVGSQRERGGPVRPSTTQQPIYSAARLASSSLRAALLSSQFPGELSLLSGSNHQALKTVCSLKDKQTSSLPTGLLRKLQLLLP